MKKMLSICLVVTGMFVATWVIAGGNGSPTGAVDKFPVCHKPGTPAEKTLWVPEAAIPGHLGHGDERGTCDGGGEPEN